MRVTPRLRKAKLDLFCLKTVEIMTEPSIVADISFETFLKTHKKPGPSNRKYNPDVC